MKFFNEPSQSKSQAEAALELPSLGSQGCSSGSMPKTCVRNTLSAGGFPALTTPGSQLGDGSLPSQPLTHMALLSSQGIGTDEKCLIEILASRTNEQIHQLVAAYKDGEMGKRGHSRFFRCVTKVLTRVGTLRLYPSTFFPPSL